MYLQSVEWRYCWFKSSLVLAGISPLLVQRNNLADLNSRVRGSYSGRRDLKSSLPLSHQVILCIAEKGTFKGAFAK